MKVDKEIAIKDIKNFVEKFDDIVKEDYVVENEFPNVVRYVENGLLVFDEDSNPILTLKYPIKNDQGDVAVSEIRFKTRVKPNDLTAITKGLNIAQNQVEYTLRCMSFLTSQPVAMINKFEKSDYKTIEQICSVFL